MQSFHFQPLTPEAPPPARHVEPRHVARDRVVYMVIFYALLALVGLYLFNRLLFVRATGRVLVKGVEVTFPSDVQVTNIRVREGQAVRVGDTLFYTLAAGRGDAAQPSDTLTVRHLTSQAEPGWLPKERLTTRRTLAQRQLELADARRQRRVLVERVAQVKSEIVLDLSTPAQLATQQDALRAQDLRISNLAQEVRMLYGYLASLPGGTRPATPAAVLTAAPPEPLAPAADGSSAGGALHPQAYRSPIAGAVARIYANEYETTPRGTAVAKLTQEAHPFVRAFVRPADVRYYDIGARVEVEFLNGVTSYGTVQQVNSINTPLQASRPFENDNRIVAIDVVPSTPDDASAWQKYQRYGVNVSRFKL